MEFNHDCADWVYDVITAMDPDEQEFFSKAFVYDLWQRDVSQNRRTLGRIADRFAEADREQVAKQCLYMLENGEDEAAVAVAASFGIVSKAFENDWYVYQERSAGGQFGRMTGAQWKARAKEAKATGKRELADLKAAHKGRARRDTSGWPDKVDQRGGAMVGGAKTFEGQWNAKPDPNLSSSQTWNRVSAGGNLANSLGQATGNTKLQAAGRAANYAGQFGPEAEKVVGPALRRSAYRYRGTEKTPDRALSQLAEEEASSVLRNVGRQKGKTVTTSTGEKKLIPTATNIEALAPEEKIYASEQAAVKYLVGGKQGNRELKSRIPSSRLSGLQRESGRVTPSEGIMINAKGDITHQAVGYAEDHYLPFNLKNLSDLKGGSYVRTRESGGITTEDIYTGLVSGARSMTVVSNSGVFTVDFDDELRGGRRYNDKAAQMVGRYAQTLDAVQSNQVENPERALSIEDRAKIRSTELKRIEESGLNIGASDEQIDTWVSQAIDRAKKQPQLSPQELEAIDQRARRGNEDDDRAYERDKKSLTQEAMQDRRSRNYQLDAEGYKVSMEALQEQFPYFISNVEARIRTDTPEAARFSTKVDRSYVKAKHIRPEGARSGWYDESIGGKKHGADTDNYQNYAWKGGSKSGTPKPTEKESEESAGVKGETRDQAAKRAAQGAESKQKKQARAQAVIDDADEYADNLSAQSGVRLAESSFPTLWEYSRARNDPDMKTAFQADEQKVKDLEKEMREGKQYLAERGSKWVAPSNLQRFDARETQGKFDPATAVKGDTSPMSPPTVTTEQYEQFTAKTEVQDALHQHASLDDDHLRQLSNKQRQALSAAQERQPGADHTALTESIKNIELLRALKQHMQPQQARPGSSVTPVPKVTAADITKPGGQAGNGLTGSERSSFVKNDLFKAVGSTGGQVARQIERLEGQFDRGAMTAADYNGNLQDVLSQSNLRGDIADDLWNKLNR